MGAENLRGMKQEEAKVEYCNEGNMDDIWDIMVVRQEEPDNDISSIPTQNYSETRSLDITVVARGDDFNSTKDIEELERLISIDHESSLTKIKAFWCILCRLMLVEWCLDSTWLQGSISNQECMVNAIMEAGGKVRPPMLAPKGSSETTIEGCMENYKNVSQDIRNQLDAEAEVMWKAIERLKQGESINVHDLETNLYWEFGKFTSRDGETLESYYSRFETLVKQCQELKTVSYHKLYDILKQHQNEATTSCTKNRGKAIVNSPQPTYDQEPTMVAEDDEMSKEKEIDKLMALDNTPRINRGTVYDNQRAVNVAGARENVGTQVVQQSGIQCYNCKEYGHVARECQNLKREKDASYHKEKVLLCKQEEAEIYLSVEQVDWRDDTDDEPEDQEFEAHYLYIAKIQEVTPNAAENSGPIFDAEPLKKVKNDYDNYNVFANDREHPEKPELYNDTYLGEQGDTNITSDSLDLSNNGEEADQDDDDLARERDLLASLIKKLKCEIDELHIFLIAL
ncbi:RNA-directed DNA polymerase, eukaryota [Tanacetum coccineum]|uniref:RNA-directed DNA polymerase, eukaryota n=1 Tax=Tanacetum coccineum TaxID=301880 RepID=A0ABQ4Z144_9ASTR